MTSDNPYESPANTAASPVRIKRKPWLLVSFLLAAFGFLVAICGGVYGVLTVGVPSQDPTPEMVLRETMHLEIAGWIMTLGVGLLVLGVLAAVLTAVWRLASMGAGDA